LKDVITPLVCATCKPGRAEEEGLTLLLDPLGVLPSILRGPLGLFPSLLLSQLLRRPFLNERHNASSK
jgi:hypothetical protein